MKRFLHATEIIDFYENAVWSTAKALAKDTRNDTEIARNCFAFVRDKIRHSGDHRDDVTTCKASEVLRHQTGWCYAKSHLLAALLRANGIPAGFCYQRLSCSEYREGIYCLHGLNWVYLEAYGWYRVDARGNKEGVDAQFHPPYEKLAFVPAEGEFDLMEKLSDPLDVVVDTLQRYGSYAQMVENFPDVEGDLC